MKRYGKTTSLVFVLVGIVVLAGLVAGKPPDKESKGGKSMAPGQMKKEMKAATTTSTEGQDSASVKKVSGWFRIHVVGTGKKCLVKEKVKGKSESEQFGDTTDTVAFLSFFGTAQCEVGDKGNAKGKIRAWVVAEAYQKGEECLAKVLASVAAESTSHKVHKDVTVEVEGSADGDALALCDDEPAA